jgi:hypothetical protein
MIENEIKMNMQFNVMHSLHYSIVKKIRQALLKMNFNHIVLIRNKL